jgi:hypothetical protein
MNTLSQTAEDHVSRSMKPLSAVLIMVCIYMFLVIERPWESVRYLQGIPVERVYAVLLIIAAFLQQKFKMVASPTNKWVYGLLALHFILAPFAYSAEYAVEQGIEYAKMVILYLLILSVADDEESLKILIKAYVFSTMFYALHSLWEYHNGRHVWRMGISRMIGADSTFSDPNSFGATIVLSLPFVYIMLRSELNKNMRRLYYLYFLLAVACVVLTGSRTSFAALLVLSAIWIVIQQGKRKLMIFAAAITAMALVWSVMPEEKRDRFRTLWDEDAGPANAKQSADGRMLGWKASWRMFTQQPFTGVGAGGKNYIGYRMTYRVDDGAPSTSQAHILYGEVLAEFGVMGAVLFTGLVVSIWRCCRLTRSRLLQLKADRPFAYNLSGAIMVTLVLLLVFGIGGHNFYRPLWLWLAAWSGSLIAIVSRHHRGIEGYS